MIDITVINFNL